MSIFQRQFQGFYGLLPHFQQENTLIPYGIRSDRMALGVGQKMVKNEEISSFKVVRY